jgi:NADH dehydrogenase [ubiquinone] 1 alpha subcomplex assembly factor 5
MANSIIFNRQRRRNRHKRMAHADVNDQWLLRAMAETLCERIADSSVRFKNALVIGHHAAAISAQLKIDCVRCNIAGNDSEIIADEDRLPVADSSFDLIIANGTLDTLDDVPGALILINRALKPNGLFVGAMMGAGALPALRVCMAEGDAQAGVAAARFHPQIDVRAAGDLLSRAGFIMPVADQDRVEARYSSYAKLIADVRANGLSNVLENSSPLSKTAVRGAISHFETMKDEAERVTELFTPLYLTGWRPATGESLPQGPVKQGFPGMG